MNVYDKAHELARELKTTPEVMEYKACKEKIDNNPTNKKMVEDFRKKQLEMYALQLQGKQPSKEQIEAFQSLGGIINLNNDVKRYLEAEVKFSQLYNDIMKILGEAAGVDLTPNV